MTNFKEFVNGIEIWLDDERDPNDPFVQKEFHSRPGMIWVKTADKAIELLNGGNVSYLSFDHDLGLGQTGYDVAKYIEEQAFNGKLSRLMWAVHSANTVGQKNIIFAMKKAEEFWSQNEKKS